MNVKSLDKAVETLNRFADAVNNLRKAHAEAHKNDKDPSPEYFCRCPKEQGALRRASLDLTRSLADLRRP